MTEDYIEVKTGQCRNCHASFGYLIETHNRKIVSEFDKCLCGAEELQRQYEGTVKEQEVIDRAYLLA